MKVKDISFKDYVSLSDRTQYDYYLEYGKYEPDDIFEIGSFFEQSFEFVKDMQYYVSEGLQWDKFLDSMSELTKKDIKELSKKSIFKLEQARLYCIEEIEKINKVERDFLGHDPTPEQISAGIDRFGRYGSFIQFDKLADGDLLKFDEIKKLKYDFCFTKLKLEADRDNFMEDYNDVMRNKNK